jgi:hypothetical protein
MLYITKRYYLLSFVENPWLWHSVFCECGQVQLSSQRQMVNEVLPNIMTKTREKQHVLPTFISHITCTTSFDIWMSHDGYDTFVMVVNFTNSSLELTHVTMGIFEMQITTNATMAN